MIWSLDEQVDIYQIYFKKRRRVCPPKDRAIVKLLEWKRLISTLINLEEGHCGWSLS